MTEWGYDFFDGKEHITQEDIEDFEAHAEMMQNRILRRKNMKKERLISLLNKLADIEPDIYKRCCHVIIDTECDAELKELEKEYPELVLHSPAFGEACRITVPSLIATITKILCGKRLCFHVSTDTLETLDFGWYENDE